MGAFAVQVPCIYSVCESRKAKNVRKDILQNTRYINDSVGSLLGFVRVKLPTETTAIMHEVPRRRDN